MVFIQDFSPFASKLKFTLYKKTPPHNQIKLFYKDRTFFSVPNKQVWSPYFESPYFLKVLASLYAESLFSKRRIMLRNEMFTF